MANIEVLREITNGHPGQWSLHFQEGIWHYGDGATPEHGYRFIYRRPDGSLQPARGQARIDMLQEAKALIERAIDEGW